MPFRQRKNLCEHSVIVLLFGVILLYYGSRSPLLSFIGKNLILAGFILVIACIIQTIKLKTELIK